jgi:hypothetical protein
MVRRREILKSAVVLVAGGLSDAIPSASASNPDARAVLRRVSQTYSAMTSYADSGAVKSVIGDDPTYQTNFATLYKAPSLFRFEFSSPHPYPPLRHIVTKHVVGFDGSTAYSTWQEYQKAPRLRTEESLDLAVAGATGISRGSAHTIGRLLFPKLSGVAIGEPLDARFADDTLIGDIPCFVILAVYRRGFEDEYAIEKQSLLIRRLRSHTGKSPAEEYRENIRVDQPIDDGLFAIAG